MQVTKPTVVHRLADYRVFLHLSPFLAKESTLAQAAQALGITTQRMSYWVNKLIKFDLIQFVRFEKSARHQAAVYRSKQDTYVIPLSAVNKAHAQIFQRALQGESFDRLQYSIARNFARHAKNAQLRLWRDTVGPRFLVENPDDPNDFFGFTSHFTLLTLDPPEIEALHIELRALSDRYRMLSNPKKSDAAILYCGLAENPILSSEI
jgi:spore coat protein U-like protein